MFTWVTRYLLAQEILLLILKKKQLLSIILTILMEAFGIIPLPRIVYEWIVLKVCMKKRIYLSIILHLKLAYRVQETQYDRPT